MEVRVTEIVEVQRVVEQQQSFLKPDSVAVGAGMTVGALVGGAIAGPIGAFIGGMLGGKACCTCDKQK